MSRLKTLARAFLVAAAFLVVPWAWMHLAYAHRTFDSVSDAPEEPVAIVFGAALWPNGLSPMLRDRVDRAVELYRAGKVRKLLMSGDNRFLYYDEPGKMAEYAMKLGVPREDVVMDFAGRRTYDTCYRARRIFGVKSAILVTQGFHIPRALFTCNHLGVKSVGVTADQNFYGWGLKLRYTLREVLASDKAVWDLFVGKPTPILGPRIDIFK